MNLRFFHSAGSIRKGQNSLDMLEGFGKFQIPQFPTKWRLHQRLPIRIRIYWNRCGTSICEKNSYRNHELTQIFRRDLAKNWEIDITTELESYLEDLEKLQVSLDGGNTTINFVEAAFIIQGSAMVYSRKVEFLHQLLYQTMDFIIGRKQQVQSSIAADGKDIDTIEIAQPEERPILSLDDVAALLSKEADHFLPRRKMLDENGEESMEASAKMNGIQQHIPVMCIPSDSSTLLSDYGQVDTETGILMLPGFELLPQPKRAESAEEFTAVAERATVDDAMMEMADLPSQDADMDEPEPMDWTAAPTMEMEMAETETDPSTAATTTTAANGSWLMQSKDLSAPAPHMQALTALALRGSHDKARPSDSVKDEWELLDPYSRGDENGRKMIEVIRPLKRGKTFVIPDAVSEVPLHAPGRGGHGKVPLKQSKPNSRITDVDYGLQKYIRRERLRRIRQLKGNSNSNSSTAFRFRQSSMGGEDVFLSQLAAVAAAPQAPESFALTETMAQASLGDVMDGHFGEEGTEDVEAGEWSELPQWESEDAQHIPVSEAILSPFKGKADGKDNASKAIALMDRASSYEALCSQYVRSMQQENAVFLQEAALHQRVESWHSRIGKMLSESEKRVSFVLETYEHTMLDSLCEKENKTMAFSELCRQKCSDQVEVCRLFITSLQLAADSALDLEVDMSGMGDMTMLATPHLRLGKRETEADFVAPAIAPAAKLVQRKLKVPKQRTLRATRALTQRPIRG
jgi:hypothetical protein